MTPFFTHLTETHLFFSVWLRESHLSEHLRPLLHHQGPLVGVRTDVTVMLRGDGILTHIKEPLCFGHNSNEWKKKAYVPSQRLPHQPQCAGDRGRLPDPSSSGWSYPPSEPPWRFSSHTYATPENKRVFKVMQRYFSMSEKTFKAKIMFLLCVGAAGRAAASASLRRGRSTRRRCSLPCRARCCWGTERCFWAPAGRDGLRWSPAPCLEGREGALLAWI